MKKLLGAEGAAHLRDWLKCVESLDWSVSTQDVNAYSQANVCFQLEQVWKFDVVQKAVHEGRLPIHGWWFDLNAADVYRWVSENNRFVVFDEDHIELLLRELEREV